MMDYFPVPCSVTLCGEPPPLSLMASDALRVPVALGVKVTEIVQLCPPKRLDPQLLPWAKSAALEPERVKDENVSVVLPTFVSRMLEGGLVLPSLCGAKVSESVDKLTSVPVPNRWMVCVGGPALSLMVITPVRSPITVGVNVAVIMQDAPTATLLPQVLVWVKFPFAVMLLVVRGSVPLFLRVTVFPALVVPTT